MKYFAPTIFSLIFVLLFLSCNSRIDFTWMRENFEENSEVIFNVTNLFNNSIPTNLREKNYITLQINDKHDCIEISIVNKQTVKGENATIRACSQKFDNKNFRQLLDTLGWTRTKADSIRNMMQQTNCNTIKTIDYKYYDIEIYNSSHYLYGYLHVKQGVDTSDVITISKISNSKYGDQFSIRSDPESEYFF